MGLLKRKHQHTYHQPNKSCSIRRHVMICFAHMLGARLAARLLLFGTRLTCADLLRPHAWNSSGCTPRFLLCTLFTCLQPIWLHGCCRFVHSKQMRYIADKTSNTKTLRLLIVRARNDLHVCAARGFVHITQHREKTSDVRSAAAVRTRTLRCGTI